MCCDPAGLWSKDDEIDEEGHDFGGVGSQVDLEDFGLRHLLPKIGRDCQWDSANTDRWR